MPKSGRYVGKRSAYSSTSCNDLVTAEAIYHISCMNRFRLLKNTSDRSSGRTIDITMIRNFERVCQWLEEQGVSDLYTLAEIHDKTEELSEGSECYSKKYLKEKLVDHYGNHIIHYGNHTSTLIDQTFFTLKTWQRGY